MQYGIHHCYWSAQWCVDIQPYIDRAASCGFHVLEVSSTSLMERYETQRELLALRSYAEKKEISLTAGCGMSLQRNLCAADTHVVQAAQQFFAALLPKLCTLGVHVLAGPMYSYAPMNFAEAAGKAKARAAAIRNLQPVTVLARQMGVTLMMEVVNRYEGYLLNTCQEAVSFINEVGSDHVKILLDTFHANIEEDSIADAIRTAGPLLGHLHVSEQNRRVPGQGSLPWAEIAKALSDISYSGAAVIESFVRTGGEVGRKAMLWRNLVSPVTDEILDHDAVAALHFLRMLMG